MKTIKKSVSDWTCGFEESYSVSEIELTINQDLINQISIAWEYLKDKGKQSIWITCKLDEVNFISDDEEFNNYVYSIGIRVFGDRTIFIECRDNCCLECYSSTIEENELKTTIN
jgi:hypothetical protein